MPDSVFSVNELLCTELSRLLQAETVAMGSGEPAAGARSPGTSEVALGSGDSVYVVVTTNEINDRHGTGPLLKRALNGQRNIFCIRSRDDWGGHDFGDWNVKLTHRERPRHEWFRHVLSVLSGRQISHVLCVPFMVDELKTSIAIKEAFGARLCAYLMDDQNVASQAIPDDLMREFLSESSLRLATHPELRSAYEQKYGLPFYLLPAIVPGDLVATELVAPPPDLERKPGILVGNFWDQIWFDRLCTALTTCGRRVEWYGNNRSPLLKFPPEKLARAGITAHGLIPEPQLADILRHSPFVIVPVSAAEGCERNLGVAAFSLPGRILFTAATSHVPVLVVGSQKTCAARFVEHFGLGVTAPYEAAAVASGMEHLCNPQIQWEIRAKAAAIAAAFSDRGVPEWLDASIDQGQPADRRFEDVFTGYDGRVFGPPGASVLP
jgi:hypothetical protein